MAKNKMNAARVQAVVAELLAMEAAAGSHAEPQNFNDIEEAMVRIGDLVACEVGVQMLARQMERPPADPPCPDCGQAGQPQGERTRQVITSRGEIPLTEAKYRCPKCRRHFFPSDERVGT